MLYLAEVQKKSGGVFGGGKGAELKLLACQRTDQSWSAVSGDEVVPAPPEEANNLNGGQLVLVEMSGNRQVQRMLPDTGRSLVGWLQNFSRQLEKSKNQEEEIEQWKQSLTYQSQELNRREMEIEARSEHLQQLEEESERLEARRQEVETVREDAERLKEEMDRNRQEMEGAWEHLRGEQRRLEERMTEFQQSAVLDDEQAGKIQDLLNRLSGAVAPTDAVREQLHQAFEIVDAQQATLDRHWQQMEQQQNAAGMQQGEVERQTQELQNRKQEWQQAQDSLDQARVELKVQQNTLDMKQDSAHMLRLQLRNQDEVHEQVSRLAATSADVRISQKVDLEALEKMPIPDLQSLVQNLQQDLEKVRRFVSDQEEELTLQRESVEELQRKIAQANAQERNSLQEEFAEEQDRYQMLDETLVGQRRNLREREEILSQHNRVLRRRQGIVDADTSDSQKIDLGPVLNQLDTQRQQQAEELQRLENQIEQMRTSIQQAQGIINQQAGEQENKRNQLKQLEQSLESERTATAELRGRVNVYQETLQSVQDGLNGIRQKFQAISAALAQIQETGDYQLQSIAEMRQVLLSLMNGQSEAA